MQNNALFKQTIKKVGLQLIYCSSLESLGLMLDSIVSMHHIMTTFLESLQDSKASNDSLLPLFIYIMIKSNPPDLWIVSELIKNYVHLFQGHVQYCATNFNAAVSFIQDLDLTQIEKV